jgi:hypothetical protein
MHPTLDEQQSQHRFESGQAGMFPGHQALTSDEMRGRDWCELGNPCVKRKAIQACCAAVETRVT